jgi:hypothetical protein
MEGWNTKGFDAGSRRHWLPQNQFAVDTLFHNNEFQGEE